MDKFAVDEHVRIKDYPIESENAFGRVQAVIDHKRYWVVNMGMPFLGSVSDIFQEHELEAILR